MNNNTIALLAFKGLAVWLILSVSGFFVGEKLITALFPLYETVAESVSDNYATKLSLREAAENKIVLAATATKAKAITPERSLPAGSTIESKITVLHALVPVVILFTVILTWPANSIRQRIALLLLAVPALVLVSAVTVPIQLLGQLEIGFQNAASAAGFTRDEPFVLTWMLLTEGGGRWFIAALTGLGCCGLVSHFIKN